MLSLKLWGKVLSFICVAFTVLVLIASLWNPTGYTIAPKVCQIQCSARPDSTGKQWNLILQINNKAWQTNITNEGASLTGYVTAKELK